MHLDPLSVNGRDGGGAAPSYAALMRIGKAARNGGDYSNAVAVFRRAAEIEPRLPDPFVALGDTLLMIGAVNEAIVAYNSAWPVTAVVCRPCGVWPGPISRRAAPNWRWRR